MALLQLNRLRTGMVTASDIRDRSGRLLLKSDTPLTENRISILKTWGFSQVEIQGEDMHTAIATDDTTEVSAVNLRRAGELMEQRFRLTDRSHPAIGTLFRYAVDYYARRLESQGRKGAS